MLSNADLSAASEGVFLSIPMNVKIRQRLAVKLCSEAWCSRCCCIVSLSTIHSSTDFWEEVLQVSRLALHFRLSACPLMYCNAEAALYVQWHHPSRPRPQMIPWIRRLESCWGWEMCACSHCASVSVSCFCEEKTEEMLVCHCKCGHLFSEKSEQVLHLTHFLHVFDYGCLVK